MPGEAFGPTETGTVAGMRRNLPLPPILVISDRKQAAVSLAEVASALFSAGCRWFSIREKDLPTEALEREVQALKPMAVAARARLSLHGSAQLARSLEMDALHLPSGSDVLEARRLMGQGAMIGLSLHIGDRLLPAQQAALDYATLSPIFPSASKPGYGLEARLSEFQDVAEHMDLPLLALGGVETAARAGQCRDYGASGIAVMGAIMRSSDPGLVFREFLEAWEAQR